MHILVRAHGKLLERTVDTLSDDELFRGAVGVLDANRTPHGTKASPKLYPHQWSWDAAFIACGLAVLDSRRAKEELASLLSGQWSNGMIPHIVFDPSATGYFPGPERWECKAVSPHPPSTVETSGIMQPPVHALALAAIMAADSRSAGENCSRWHSAVLAQVVAWHRYLLRERLDPETGLLVLFHGWESGMDNSPRWDIPYEHVVPGADLPPYDRLDTRHVGSVRERPGTMEYDRYLWLLEEGKRAGYEPSSWREVGSFQVGDVFSTALFAAASEVAATCADELGQNALGTELLEMAERAREGVRAHIDPKTGCAHDVDLRTGGLLPHNTIAAFAPLLCLGADDPAFEASREIFFSDGWCGAGQLAFPLPPSTAPGSAAFEETRYWRGPVWPIMNWLFSWSLGRAGDIAGESHLREHGLDQLRDGTFAEYYHPFTGDPLGSISQSWTAAAALLWLGNGRLVHRASGMADAHGLT